MQNDAKKERQTKKANSKNGYSKKQTDKNLSVPYFLLLLIILRLSD